MDNLFVIYVELDDNFEHRCTSSEILYIEIKQKATLISSISRTISLTKKFLGFEVLFDVTLLFNCTKNPQSKIKW